MTWWARLSGVPVADDVDALSEAFDTDGLDGWTWATAGLVLAAAIAVAIVVRWSLGAVLVRRLERSLAIFLARAASYVVVLVGFVYALDQLRVRVGPLIGALGIAGIALAFALKDILENFVAGILLQIQRPFSYGHEIEINDQVGRVQDVNARFVTMLTPSGETVMVPSAVVIKSELSNMTVAGRRRTDLEIGVAYGSDLRESRSVLERAARSVDGVLGDPGAEVLLTGFGDSSIDFVVRYWHGPSIAEFWRVRSDVAFAVEAALDEAGITIPFPQRTLWFPDGSAADGEPDAATGAAASPESSHPEWYRG